MPTHPLITFLSDFGAIGGYVAACELVMVRLAPTARIVHLCHAVPPGDIRQGALLLARLAPLAPVAVHLGVVDPGVGTGREALCIACRRGDLLVGPNNGLLLTAAQVLGGLERVWSMAPGILADKGGRALDRGRAPSRTFHGRDVFAPAAALLALGQDPAEFGPELDCRRLVQPPLPRTVLQADRVVATIIEIDTFGNIELSAPFEAIEALAKPSPDETGKMTEIECRLRSAGCAGPVHRMPLVHVFADLDRGRLGILRDSWGKAAIVAGQSSAAKALGAVVGDEVELTPAAAEEEQGGIG